MSLLLWNGCSLRAESSFQKKKVAGRNFGGSLQQEVPHLTAQPLIDVARAEARRDDLCCDPD